MVTIFQAAYLSDLCLALWEDDAVLRAAETIHEVTGSAAEGSRREVSCVGYILCKGRLKRRVLSIKSITEWCHVQNVRVCQHMRPIY